MTPHRHEDRNTIKLSQERIEAALEQMNKVSRQIYKLRTGGAGSTNLSTIYRLNFEATRILFAHFSGTGDDKLIILKPSRRWAKYLLVFLTEVEYFRSCVRTI